MTATDTGSPTQGLTLRIPEPTGLMGSTSARRARRGLLVLGLGWLLALAAVLADVGAGPEAALLALTFPGAGLLAGGHPVLAVVAALVVVLALVAWWFLGATVLPPLVALGLAAWSAGVAEPGHPTSTTVALLLAPTAVVVSVAAHAVRHRAQARRGAVLNAELATVRFDVSPPPDLDAGLPVAESTAEDLARLRFGLDLALQPLESFEGFTHLDQYREAALRYQLNALSYGLSMAQLTRTPAFHGYLAEAQRNAIEKMLDRRVWGYWAHENAWGNLRWDPEPVENSENIMLTGFFGLMLTSYETVTGDDRYARPGAHTFRWSERRSYPHDLGTIAASIHRNTLANDYALFPCEPNWVYTVCNTFGANTLLAHDRLRGTSYSAETLDRLHDGYEREFFRPDGKLLGVRATHLGLSWNFWANPSVQTTTAFWMHPALTDLSLRTWWLLKRDLEIRDGLLHLPRFLTKGLDPGSYLLGRDTFGQAVAMMAAREIGDEEYAQAAQRTLDEREPVEDRDGVRRMSDASGLANLYATLGRFLRKDGLGDLVAHGVPDAWHRGPVLAECAYPEVLVARAVTDGTALDLVLLPGAGPVRTTLSVERLDPGRTYTVSGGLEPTVTADAEGRAMVGVDLGGRHEVRLH
jgi:hypothetical protein